MDVLLPMDSLTRLARAQREVGLSSGEVPRTRDYPPSVFTMLLEPLERAGPGERRTITGLYTVLVEADDMNEPIAAAVLLALLLSLPTLLLDLLLALSLGAAADVLVVALATSDLLSLTSLSPLLVLSSLGRIVLCLCISRLLLVGGEAGTLVPTLGAASAGADPIAGIGVLIVLAVVQVVMVTSGVGRMAEVAARFALDALPGKQMGVDTAVGAGQMSRDEARGEIGRLERAANFYGAMDGAGRGGSPTALIERIFKVRGGVE